MIRYNQIIYRVNLQSGGIEFISQPYNEALNCPHKYCKSLYEADLYSLNILKQNILESRAKGTGTESITRIVLGESQSIATNAVGQHMTILQDKYPEEFI